MQTFFFLVSLLNINNICKICLPEIVAIFCLSHKSPRMNLQYFPHFFYGSHAVKKRTSLMDFILDLVSKGSSCVPFLLLLYHTYIYENMPWEVFFYTFARSSCTKKMFPIKNQHQKMWVKHFVGTLFAHSHPYQRHDFCTWKSIEGCETMKISQITTISFNVDHNFRTMGKCRKFNLHSFTGFSADATSWKFHCACLIKTCKYLAAHHQLAAALGKFKREKQQKFMLARYLSGGENNEFLFSNCGKLFTRSNIALLTRN